MCSNKKNIFFFVTIFCEGFDLIEDIHLDEFKKSIFVYII